MYKIFIIEDDEKLYELTREYLERYGYQVFGVVDFKNVEMQYKSIRPHLVLMDINLPYFDGFHLCRILRKENNSPIIFTSARNSDFEQVRALELGADDYVTKPFSFELLHAKIKASLRRCYGEYSIESETEINAGGLILDKDKFSANYMGKVAELSKTEFKLLKKLLENRDKVVTRETLLEELWDESTFVDDNTLTVNVTRVKSKLNDLGLSDAVKTKRGVGYIFDAKNV